MIITTEIVDAIGFHLLNTRFLQVASSRDAHCTSVYVRLPVIDIFIK